MCGIAGIVGGFAREECLDIVRRMTGSIVHRGPDDEGCWGTDGFAFGMRRLSIIDLAGGHQPMWDDEQRHGVVFNGEIYNYRELRERFGGDTAFVTHSDTEVVLRSLARHGLKAVDLWNGMFAVAAWDSHERTLLLIRDRVGVKPLYYYWDGRVLLFASEIKALLASGLVPREVNTQAIWNYLTFRYVPGPESIWRGIRKLPPGHALQFSPGSGPREVEYWRTDVVAEPRPERDAEARIDREFAELFIDAVRLRLIAADVPVGVLLSGGLDSSAVAAAAVELGHRNFHTFSIGFDDGRYSELPYARRMAEHVGAQYHEITINQREFLDLLPQVVVAADEPLADLASVPLLAVSRLARRHVKVVLSGEGSDELLAGYDLDRAERRWALVRQIQRVPRPLLAAGAAAVAAVAPPRAAAARRVATMPVGEWTRADLEHMTWLLDEASKRRLWPSAAAESSARHLEAQYAAASSSDPLQQMLSVYQKSWLVEDLLMKADKMSMAASIELRTPFLDYRLVEWANRQPNAAKVKRVGIGRYQTKAVLRRFAARRVPTDILTRPKRGFPVPAYEWLRHGLSSWAGAMLLQKDSRVAGAFNGPMMRDLIAGAASGDDRAAHNVWNLIVLEQLCREWHVTL